jgi:hypothetical protein
MPMHLGRAARSAHIPLEQFACLDEGENVRPCEDPYYAGWWRKVTAPRSFSTALPLFGFYISFWLVVAALTHNVAAQAGIATVGLALSAVAATVQAARAAHYIGSVKSLRGEAVMAVQLNAGFFALVWSVVAMCATASGALWAASKLDTDHKPWLEKKGLTKELIERLFKGDEEFDHEQEATNLKARNGEGDLQLAADEDGPSMPPKAQPLDRRGEGPASPA